MLILKTLSMRNFFSFGNVPQVIDFTETDMALVLGQNNDAGDDEGGRRNGVGKSAMVQGLVYALYGKSIDNSIKVQNLVNKTNEKGMVVELQFMKDNKYYVVQRARSPAYFHFFEVDENGDKLNDETRGETDSTQEDLDAVLKIPQALFEQIVVMNTTVDPFLKLSAGKQREMIEELLGLTELTEKAVQLKDMAKEARRLADQEKLKNDTIASSNEKILSTVQTLEASSSTFNANKEKEIQGYQEELKLFEGIDLDALLNAAHEVERVLAHNAKRESMVQNVLQLGTKQEAFNVKTEHSKNEFRRKLAELASIDIDAELELHSQNATIRELAQILNQNKSLITSLEAAKAGLNNKHSMIQMQIAQRLKTIADMQENVCPTCKQDVPCTQEHTARITALQNEVLELDEQQKDVNEQITKKQEEINAVELFDVPVLNSTVYDFESEAKMHLHKMQDLQAKIDEAVQNPYDADITEALNSLELITELPVPESTYNVQDVQSLKYQLQTLQQNLDRAAKSENPYTAQIEALLSTGIQEVSYEEYDRQLRIADHQEFLSKLLMNKDSHVRKVIIEQSIPFLNTRLLHYITESGSQHQVQFQNDLSVQIEHMGREYDFSQLSRGERARVIISLNNAFRDTYESLKQFINLVIVDELIDDGLDTNGVECAWRTLQDMSAQRSKNVCVVSHREELHAKAENIILVERDSGFSRISRTNSVEL